MPTDSIADTQAAASRAVSYTARILASFKDTLEPIRQVLEDESVTDVMVNAPNDVFIRQNGKDKPLGVRLSAGQIDSAITLLASLSDKQVGKQNLLLSARFPGFRVEAVLPPVSVRGPSMCIRRHASRVMTLEDYRRTGTITERQGRLIEDMVAERRNFLIAGGTFSGKTTLMNCVLSLINPKHRLYVIEQVQELKVISENHVLMECDPDQGVNARDLVKVAMRYNPDRIILGELRDGAAYDWMDASNTGHPGSGATIHADSAKDAIYRLESLVMMAESGIPHNAIQQRIGSTLGCVLFIHQEDGTRRLSQICHVDGFDRLQGEYRTSVLNHGD